MSIRTTVTLDDDVLARVRDVSRVRGKSFRNTLNELLREALVKATIAPRRRTLQIQASPMGPKKGLNYDNVESLLEYAEGERHR